MGGQSKPLLPIRAMLSHIRTNGVKQLNLAILGSLFSCAGLMSIGIGVYSFTKPEVGARRSTRNKFGQYESIEHNTPTSVLFVTKNTQSVWKHDPYLAVLHHEIYGDGKFDVDKK